MGGPGGKRCIFFFLLGVAVVVSVELDEEEEEEEADEEEEEEDEGGAAVPLLWVEEVATTLRLLDPGSFAKRSKTSFFKSARVAPSGNLMVTKPPPY